MKRVSVSPCFLSSLPVPPFSYCHKKRRVQSPSGDQDGKTVSFFFTILILFEFFYFILFFFAGYDVGVFILLGRCIVDGVLKVLILLKEKRKKNKMEK